MRFSRCSSGWTAAIIVGLALTVLPKQAFAQRPLGIDVSSYQDEPNWTDVKSAGITFAWAKATEGTFYIDADYTYNEANAKSAGVYIGSYHFAHPEEDLGTSGADTEAAYFWNEAGGYIKNGGTYLMPALDYETAPGSSYTATTSSEWVNEWCNDITNDAFSANDAVVKPIVYTYTSFADDYLTSLATEWPLWMASPNGDSPQTGAPSSTYPWSSWTFWQYGEADISGITTGAVDEDVFNGTSTTLKNYVIGAYSVSITGPPASVTVTPGTNMSFTVIATTTGGTLHYQWQFDGTNIASATTTQYAVNNAQQTNAGGYSVTVSNTTGTNSATGYLSVRGPLTNAPGSIVGPADMLNWWPADGNTIDILNADNGAPQGSLGYAPGEDGLAFNFNGSNTVIATPATDIPGNWTACMWVNRQNSPQTSASLLEDGGAYALKLEQYDDTRDVGVSVNGVNYKFSPAYSVPVGTWTHLAFVGTPTSTSLYVNGVFKSSLTNVVHLPRTYIGGGYNGTNYENFMLGYLDDVMTFDAALNATQIAAIYNTGSAGLVRAPQILNAAQTGANQVTINVEGQTGKSYTVYTSPDLINWTNVATLANPNGTNQYIDSNTTNSQTFYLFKQTY